MVNTLINGKYNLMLPEHRAARPEWDIKNGGWEVKRIDAMVECLNTISNKVLSAAKFPVLFDIGTEEGDISALLVKETDCDIVMFEPNDRVWSCIAEIWRGNELKKPLDFYGGFLSSKSSVNSSFDLPSVGISNFIGELIPDHGFKQLYENYPDVPQITMDDYCELTGIYPDVITMDVEGAEFRVIKGAVKTLKEKKPIIFMSVHPEFMAIHYNDDEQSWAVNMIRFINELGYRHEVIEWDYHEIHVMFTPV